MHLDLLSIDPGVSQRGGCGVAHLVFEGPRVAHVETVLVRRAKGDTGHTDVLRGVAAALAELRGMGTTHIAVENQVNVAVGAQARGQWGASNLGVLLVQGLVYGLGLEVAEMEPQQVKTAVAGSARATKAQVEAGVRRRLGRASPAEASEHEWDAIAIGIAARFRIVSPAQPQRAAQLAILDEAKRRAGRAKRARGGSDRRPRDRSGVSGCGSSLFDKVGGSAR